MTIQESRDAITSLCRTAFDYGLAAQTLDHAFDCDVDRVVSVLAARLGAAETTAPADVDAAWALGWMPPGATAPPLLAEIGCGSD